MTPDSFYDPLFIDIFCFLKEAYQFVILNRDILVKTH